jgi:hypothetical protein
VDNFPLKKTPLTFSCSLPLLNSHSPSCLMLCWSSISHFDLFDFIINIFINKILIIIYLFLIFRF